MKTPQIFKGMDIDTLYFRLVPSVFILGLIILLSFLGLSLFKEFQEARLLKCESQDKLKGEDTIVLKLNCVWNDKFKKNTCEVVENQ